MNIVIQRTIEDAIANRNLIKFSYHGYERIVEPHVFGIYRDRLQLLAFQVGGQSGSRPMGWPRFNLEEALSLVGVSEHFSGPRPVTSGRSSKWDDIFAVVM